MQESLLISECIYFFLETSLRLISVSLTQHENSGPNQVRANSLFLVNDLNNAVLLLLVCFSVCYFLTFTFITTCTLGRRNLHWFSTALSFFTGYLIIQKRYLRNRCVFYVIVTFWNDCIPSSFVLLELPVTYEDVSYNSIDSLLENSNSLFSVCCQKTVLWAVFQLFFVGSLLNVLFNLVLGIPLFSSITCIVSFICN